MSIELKALEIRELRAKIRRLEAEDKAKEKRARELEFMAHPERYLDQPFDSEQYPAFRIWDMAP